jgi:hypothetical protein
MPPMTKEQQENYREMLEYWTRGYEVSGSPKTGYVVEGEQGTIVINHQDDE